MENGIDIVIPWVDGDDPKLRAKREHYAGVGKTKADASPEDEYALDLRWDDFNEIHICLWSIHNFAPWVRRIWMITDEQTPELGSLPEAFRDKITVLDHRDIFAGYEEVLPTFNSATILSACWRIPGLSDQFIVTNDDVFFVGPVQPEDFVRDGNPVLRGKFNRRLGAGSTLWSSHIQKAARLAGLEEGEGFSPGHVCHTLDRRLIEDFFAANPDSFAGNIQHRFRHPDQFNISALGTNLMVRSRNYVAAKDEDWLHIPAMAIETKTPQRIRQRLAALRDPKVKLACVNNLRVATEKLPRSMDILQSIIKFP